MTVAANVISIVEFRDRRAAAPRAEILVLAATAGRRIELASMLVRAGLVGGRVDWADTLDAAERRLTETAYRLHVFDLGTDPMPAAPLVDALLGLPDRRTVLVCHTAESEIAELRDRFPSATVVAGTDLTVEWLHGSDGGPSRRDIVPGAASGLEGLIASAVALRASVAGIGKQMAVADSELDAGKSLDGQIHLVAAMQRLTEVEARLGVLETDLRAQIDRGHIARP